ncbi:winged helix-turn-helix transcriptional regulator [Saccharothrix variisporea]|uniref:HxlR family transcriptional regulator n=1 Tax=Saccharothrix variisporea TaxID=543527 RepID=A0A495XE87_9PSEU|nr:helix-turn-helix domain-containing protein [Saccharothrix variisporea]RKT70923.1 HxlR family transcriptional regulator [Saccharothrix variisporea]
MECPTSAIPFRIGDKWTAMVVLCLEDGPRRFTELRAALPRVTAKVLTETLRAMERDGFARRTDHGGNPPHVEYALTPLGRSLLALVDAVREWTARHLDEVLAHRAADSAVPRRDTAL